MTRIAQAALVCLILIGSVSPAAFASTDPDTASVELPIREEESWAPGNKGRALWFWPAGGRVYQLDTAGGSSFSVLKAYDEQTLQEVASAELKPPAWGDPGPNEFSSGAGRHHVAAVNPVSGRVFVAHRHGVYPMATGEHTSEPPCAAVGTVGDPGCVGGVHVLDGATLAPVGRIPLTRVSVDTPRLAVIPRAMTFAPADTERGWGERLLMVVEEVATGPTESSVVPGLAAAAQNAVPRRNSGNLSYVVSLDPTTMQQEWAVRLEGCRNSREYRTWFKTPEGHPTTVFRVGGEAPAVYVGCHGNPSQQGVVVRVPLDDEGVPMSTPVVVSQPDLQSLDPRDTQPSPPVAPAPRQEAFPGPDKVTVILADPSSSRLLMRVNDGGEVWWVFDGQANQYIGTVGIGDYQQGHTSYGLDPATGRLYVLAAKPTDATGPGGLYLADIRRNPLPQALFHGQFADPPRRATGFNTSGATPETGWTMSVRPRSEAGLTRLFQTTAYDSGAAFRVLADTSPVSTDSGQGEEVVRTLDIPELAGATQATFDGTARGFGLRTILIGGVEGASRAGPVDGLGVLRGVPDADGYNHSVDVEPQPGGSRRLCGHNADAIVPGNPLNSPFLSLACDNPAVVPFTTATTPALPGQSARAGFPLVGETVSRVYRPDPCVDAQRELIVAFAGPQSPAVVDASSARGETQPVVADVRTREDLAAPITRCAPRDWKALWDTALVSQAPSEEPGADWPFKDARSSCTTTQDDVSESWSDPVLGAFSSHVACSEDEVQGWGQARGVDVDGVSVAHTLSTFRIYRDPGRGMVARVESIARGIDIAGLVKIDTVRGVAESWANGRATFEDPDKDGGDAFNPWNCDITRSAGTCFQRHIFGVTAKDPRGGTWRCGPCGPEEDFISAMNRAFGAYGQAQFREPDRDLARGSADGYVAAITKKDKERFADIVLNSDLLETMVPMLEVIRYAPHNRPEQPGQVGNYSFGTPPRGRQVFQFAAVEVSSTYSIQCLLVYDEASTTCSEAPESLGSLSVSLSDHDGKPLAGGAFEVRQDVDADGVLGLKDTLLPNGACVTTDDGVGTCRFEDLRPGGYLVSQVAAPPGYSKSSEPFVVELASGEARTVAFTNVSNLSSIELKVSDEAGAPLAGATFAAYPDGDADGKVAPDAKPVAECTTDAQGTCSMQVPAGSYVLVQTSAPGGLEGIEPVPFTFSSGGQVASVTVVNYPPESPQAPDAPAAPIYTPPVDTAPPAEFVDEGYTPPADSGLIAPETVPGPSLGEQVGGTVVQVIRAPGDALRLLSRDPKQAVAWTAALALFCLAATAVRRRQHALALIAD